MHIEGNNGGDFLEIESLGDNMVRLEIGKALKGAGFTAYSHAKEAEMFAALEAHANHAANKEAA